MTRHCALAPLLIAALTGCEGTPTQEPVDAGLEVDAADARVGCTGGWHAGDGGCAAVEADCPAGTVAVGEGCTRPWPCLPGWRALADAPGCEPPPLPECPPGSLSLPGGCGPAWACPIGWLRDGEGPGCAPPPAPVCPEGQLAIPGGDCLLTWPCPAGWVAHPGGGCEPGPCEGCTEPHFQACEEAPRPPPGAVFVEAGAGDGDGTRERPFGTLARALGEGAAVLVLAPGRYDSPGPLQDVHLIGACAGEVVWAPGERIEAQGAVALERLTLEADLLGSRESTLSLREIDLRGSLSVLGEAEVVDLRVRPSEVGILVGGGAVLRCERCAIEDSAYAGIQVRPDGQATVSSSRVDGLRLVDGVGQAFLVAGDLELVDSRITGSAGGALTMQAPRASATLRRVHVSNCAAGLGGANGHLVVEDAVLSNIQDLSLFAGGGLATDARRVRIERPPGEARVTAALTGGQLRLTEAIFENLSGVAVYVDGESSAELRGLQIDANEQAVDSLGVQALGRVVLEGAALRGKTLDGMLVEAGGRMGATRLRGGSRSLVEAGGELSLREVDTDHLGVEGGALDLRRSRLTKLTVQNATVLAEDVFVGQGSDSAIAAARSDLELRRVAIRDVTPIEGRLSTGIFLEDAVALIDQVSLRDAGELAIAVTRSELRGRMLHLASDASPSRRGISGADSVIQLEGLAIEGDADLPVDTRTTAFEVDGLRIDGRGEIGWMLFIDSQIRMTGAWLSAQAGRAVHFEGGTARLSSIAVTDLRPRQDGVPSLAVGMSAEAQVRIDDLWLDNALAKGLSVQKGAQLDLRRAVLRGIRPDPGAGDASGIIVARGRARVEQMSMLESAHIGLGAVLGAHLDASDLFLRGGPPKDAIGRGWGVGAWEASMSLRRARLEAAGGVGVLASASALAAEQVAVIDTRSDPDGRGGFGVLAQGHSTLELRDARIIAAHGAGLLANDGSQLSARRVHVADTRGSAGFADGIVALGGAEVNVVGATLVGNGRAGALVSDAALSLSEALVQDNEVGILRERSTRITLSGVRFADNEEDEQACATTCVDRPPGRDPIEDLSPAE